MSKISPLPYANKFDMANLNLKLDADQIMREAVKAAPVILLLAAFASFFIVGVFCVDYYESLFSRFKSYSRPMAVMVAIVQESVRFGLLITSIRDFNDGKRFNGWIGLFMSAGLVWHDINLAHSIAAQWSAENPLPYLSVFIFLILLGLGLELRLILTVDLSKVERKNKVPGKSQNGVGSAKEILISN